LPRLTSIVSVYRGSFPTPPLVWMTSTYTSVGVSNSRRFNRLTFNGKALEEEEFLLSLTSAANMPALRRCTGAAGPKVSGISGSEKILQLSP